MANRREFSKATKRAALERSAMRSKGKCLKWIEALLSSEEDEGACIEWPFSKRGNGYGQVFIAGRRTTSNNLICEMAHGPAPEVGMHAAHSCGKNWCSNHHHILWKSPKANGEDKLSHGTQRRGSQIYSAKIMEDDVGLIRRRASNGESLRSIGKDFGLSPQGVWDITSRKNWRHV